MTNKRVKSFAVEDDYEDDTYDDVDYEEDPELQQGTVKVRSALGPASATTTDKEIQDTLWHYYYDVPKSVSYLRRIKDPAHKETAKPASQTASQQPLGEYFPLSSICDFTSSVYKFSFVCPSYPAF